MDKKVSIWNATFVSAFIANICISIGQQLPNTLLPKYVNSLGATASLVGFVSSAFAITAIVIRPFSGPAYDSFSNRKLLIITEFFVLAGVIIYGSTTNITVIIIARLIHGVGTGCITPLIMMLASNSLPNEILGQGIGMFSIAGSVAQAIGPSIGLALANKLGYSKAFYISAIIIVVAIIVAFRIKEVEFERPPYKIALNRIVDKRALLPAIFMMLISCSYASISSNLAILGEKLNIGQIGLFFTAWAIVMLVTRPFIGKLIDKLGFQRVMIPGFVLFIISMVILFIARTLPMFIVSAIFASLGYGTCSPTIQSLVMKSCPRNMRGAGSNTNYLCTDIGMLLGPIIAGRVIDSMLPNVSTPTLAYSRMFLVMTIPTIIAIVVFIFIKNKIQTNIEEVEEIEKKAGL